MTAGERPCWGELDQTGMHFRNCPFNHDSTLSSQPHVWQHPISALLTAISFDLPLKLLRTPSTSMTTTMITLIASTSPAMEPEAMCAEVNKENPTRTVFWGVLVELSIHCRRQIGKMTIRSPDAGACSQQCSELNNDQEPGTIFQGSRRAWMRSPGEFRGRA
jgi:hypothetical protein